MEDLLAKTAKHWSQSQAAPPRIRWWQSRLICRHINRRICGREVDGTDGGDVELLRKLAQGQRYGRAVSVGCGNAYHELKLLEAGVVEHFVVYELSETRAAEARASADRLGLSERLRVKVTDAFAADDEEGFDLVYWKDALHHMFDAAAAVRWSHDVLRPGGVFFMNEFVGPTRMQFTERQLDLAEMVRRALPDHFLLDPMNPGERVVLRRVPPTVQGMLQADPSECADSSNILPAAKLVFSDLEVIPTGGIAYVLALKDILTNIDEERDAALLRSLMLADDLCIEAGETLHAVACARRPRASSQLAGTPRSTQAAAGADPFRYLTAENELAHPLWLDLPDASATLQHKLDTGEVNASEAAILSAFMRDGYATVDLGDLEAVIGDLLDDVDRLWQAPPSDLAGAGHVNGGRPLPLSELAPQIERGPGVRILDLHSHSDAARELYLNEHIHRLCSLVLGHRAVATQTLFFEYGSGQSLHRDPWYVNHHPRSHLVAAWFALEDVLPDAGPLMYVPRSHKLPYYRFATDDVVFHDPRVSGEERNLAIAHMHQQMAERGLVAEPALPRLGQVFLWHGSLIHGGSPVINPALTRRSLVVHFGRLDTHPRRGTSVERHGKSQVFRTEAKHTSARGAIGFHNPLAGTALADEQPPPTAHRAAAASAEPTAPASPEPAAPVPTEPALPQLGAVGPLPPRAEVAVPMSTERAAPVAASPRAPRSSHPSLRKLRKLVRVPSAFFEDSPSPALRAVGGALQRLEVGWSLLKRRGSS
jgi:ectoine hydroxylase-related dioxygenase (phytanoyl-CoA dioxygenase family)/SAM-dependent methyltransferase